jgi:hypothetical protein
MAYDEAERNAEEVFPRFADPQHEINTGAFPHGGVKQLITWLDDHDQPTPRSRATRRHLAELDEDGQTIWEELEPVTPA